MVDDYSDDHDINWLIVGAATLIGVGVVGLGLWLDDAVDFDRWSVEANWNADAWSGLSIEIGAGIALLAVLFFLERRLMSKSERRAVSVARAVVEEATAGLVERVTSLEELSSIQREYLGERQREAARERETLRSNPSAEGVLRLLQRAGNKFDGDVDVRTTDGPDGVIISFGASGGVVQLSLPEEAGTSWEREPVDEMAKRLVDILESLNIAADRFDFGYALTQLLRSEEVMDRARAAESGDPARLEGRLQILVNEDWALTSYGLEAVNDDRRFKAVTATRPGGPVGGRRILLAVDVPDDVRNGADGTLRDALDWLKQQGVGLNASAYRSGPGFQVLSTPHGND